MASYSLGSGLLGFTFGFCFSYGECACIAFWSEEHEKKSMGRSQEQRGGNLRTLALLKNLLEKSRYSFGVWMLSEESTFNSGW